jgi:hypothetical protein
MRVTTANIVNASARGLDKANGGAIRSIGSELVRAVLSGETNMRVKIEVTQDDIEKGKRNQCNLCPVARAVKRVAHIWGVGSPGVYPTERMAPLNSIADLPYKARTFVCRFDNALPVKPFTFTLNIPKEYLR